MAIKAYRTIYLRPEEDKMITEASRTEGVSASSFIRTAVLERLGNWTVCKGTSKRSTAGKDQ